MIHDFIFALCTIIQPGQSMYKYAIWARINDFQTVNTIVWAKYDSDAKMIAEAQFGVGNVLSYSRIDE